MRPSRATSVSRNLPTRLGKTIEFLAAPNEAREAKDAEQNEEDELPNFFGMPLDEDTDVAGNATSWWRRHFASSAF